MKINARFRLQILVQNSLFVVLLIAIVASVLYLTRDVKTQWDLTQSKRNTLSQASIDILDDISGPITITAYATAQDAEGDLRKLIQGFITPYQRAKDDVSLTFVDPREDPGQATKAGVRVNGELVVELSGRSENLDTLTEQELTNLLVRLMRSAERMVTGLDGHGEGKLDGRANFDLGELGNQLTAKGFRTGSVNLAIAQDVPDNTSVLVIAGPRVDLLPGEVNRIKRFLEKGGNLLWLIDYDSLRGMDAIAEYLGLDLIDGIVIDPAAGRLKLPGAFALASGYGEHPITQRSTLTTVFPYARQIAAHEDSSFHFTPLIEAAAGGWLETSGLSNAEFGRDSDIRGPIAVSAALERDVGNSKQRVVVVGSSKGLSNEYVGLLGNVDLGINIMNWLAGDDSLITIQPKSRADLTLELSRGALIAIGFGFLIILPLGLLVAGGVIWWKRRRS
jgi:ABC-type uncharacterized transport system involved in gliding motility auxiliary subunit